MESWYRTNCLGRFGYRIILRPISGLSDRTVPPATARQPSLISVITPLNSLLSVLDLTGEIVDFTLTNTDLNNQHERSKSMKVVDSQTSSSSCPPKGQPSQFLVNAAPCRMLGQESFKCEKFVSAPADRTTARTERLFSRIIVTRGDQCPQAQKCLSD